MIPFVVRSVFTRFWTLLTLKYLLLSLLCWFSAFVNLRVRIPGSFLFLIIPWVGTVLTVLSFIFLTKHLFGNIPLLKPVMEGIQKIEWLGNTFIRVFIYYSLLLFANGILDFSEPEYHSSKIIEKFGAETQISGTLPYAWADLASWDDSQGKKRVILQEREKRDLWGGELIIVQIHKGSLGIPWIKKILRDEEEYSTNIIKHTPKASAAWKRLIGFYMEQKKWEDAAITTRKYLKIFPNDFKTAMFVGSENNTVHNYDFAKEFFEYSIAIKPTYKAYQGLGWALSYNNEGEKAAKVLEKSLEIDPYNYEAYYHLGYVYFQINELEKAIWAFEETLKRRSPFPEVENELKQLRHFLEQKKARYKS